MRNMSFLRIQLLYIIFIIPLLSISLMGEGYITQKPYSARIVKPPQKQQKPQVYMIDDFEDGNYEEKPEWWHFGNIDLKILKNTPEKGVYLGKESLQIKGSTNEWYIGGIGRYLGIETNHYNTLKLVVYSNGYNSGMLKVELYDDDNRNWQVDLDFTGKTPTQDDIFAYNLILDWTGWRVVSIPFSALKDANPGIGDDIWNPHHDMGSGGLLQMQLLLLTAKEKNGDVKTKVDVIKLVNIN